MKQFNHSQITRFITSSFIAIAIGFAYLEGILFSQGDFSYDENYSSPAPFPFTPPSHIPVEGQWPVSSRNDWENQNEWAAQNEWDNQYPQHSWGNQENIQRESDFNTLHYHPEYFDDHTNSTSSSSWNANTQIPIDSNYSDQSINQPQNSSYVFPYTSPSTPTYKVHHTVFDTQSNDEEIRQPSDLQQASSSHTPLQTSSRYSQENPKENSWNENNPEYRGNKEQETSFSNKFETEESNKKTASLKPKESFPKKDPLNANDEKIDETLAVAEDQQKIGQNNFTPSDDEELISAAASPLVSPRASFPLAPVANPTQRNSNAAPQRQEEGSKEISNLNFNNVAMVEYIRFISRLSNKNFIFDDEDLQFNVTIVSEEPTTVSNLMSALLQELQIHDLSINEQGNNIIIHRNPRVRSPARIVAEGTNQISSRDSELVTRVFRLNTLDPVKASEIIRPLLSDDALIEVLKDSNNLILTDLVSNVNKIAQLIGTLDAPNSGVTLGQYVVRNAFVDSLAELANKILQPIAQGNPFVLVPHPITNSIYIVSNAFIVEKALAILQNLDLNEGRTKILSLETLRPAYTAPKTGNTPGSAGGTGTSAGAGGRGTVQGGIGGVGGVGGAAGQRNNGGTDTNDQENAAGSISTQPREGLFPGQNQAGQGPGTPSSFPFGPGGISASGSPGIIGQEGVAGVNQGAFPTGGLSSEGGRPALTPYGANGQGFGPGGFGPGGVGSEGRRSAIFDESRDFLPGGVGSASRWARDLPVGHIERTLFFIYKLRYRKGDNIEIALRKIANSLQLTGTANGDLVAAINSSQWIDSSNALIFTGTATALEKVRELILEIDVPLRQVFIEMLILDTTITDSLSYSVDWINRFGGGTTTGEEGFFPPTPGASDVNFLNSAETIQNTGNIPNTSTIVSPLPVAQGFLGSGGFLAGIIGTHLTHNGTRFSSIGALVRAIHTDGKANILLNPKIITEDNNPAEIFVGGTDRYKTQSIANDLGSIITNNFQFIDVGTTLRVTPLIGNNGIITLEIVQERTAPAPGGNTNGSNQDVNLVQVLYKTRTVTKIHVPDGFFVVLSGMIQDNETRTFSRIPCLGGIPIIGGFGKTQTTTDLKSNHMIFIRPLIIDNDEDLEDVTRRQQDVYREKCKFRRSWNYEIDESLNFLNIKPTDPDEIGCDQR